MSILTGISLENCATACNRERCVISNKPFCFHPKKGGVPERWRDDPEIQRIYSDACAVVGVEKLKVEP